jgi:hypothetical protein
VHSSAIKSISQLLLIAVKSQGSFGIKPKIKTRLHEVGGNTTGKTAFSTVITLSATVLL